MLSNGYIGVDYTILIIFCIIFENFQVKDSDKDKRVKGEEMEPMIFD